MIKRLLIYCITIIIASFFLSSCGQEELKFTQYTGLSESDSLLISFSNVIDGDYEGCILIPPYTYLDRLSDSLGIDFKKVSKTGIEYRDDITVLVCVKNTNLEDYYILSHEDFQIKGMNHYELIKRDELLLLTKDERFSISKVQ